MPQSFSPFFYLNRTFWIKSILFLSDSITYISIIIFALRPEKGMFFAYYVFADETY